MVLDVDEIVNFKITGVPEQAVLTGVIGDGSCYLHALVTNISPETFMTYTVAERMDYIAKTRATLADNLTLEIWKRISNGELAILTFSMCLLQKVQKNIKEIHDSPDSFIKNYLENSIEKIMKIDKYTSYLDIDKLVNYIPENSKEFIRKLSIQCEKECFQIYKNNLRNTHYWIDDYYLEYLSDIFNVNIILIKSDGSHYVISRPICEDMLKVKNDRMFMLLHYIDSVHY